MKQEYPEEYYEYLERTMGREAADWSRLPPEERLCELEWYHANFNTPNDLSIWPPELGGDDAMRNETDLGRTRQRDA